MGSDLDMVLMVLLALFLFVFDCVDMFWVRLVGVGFGGFAVRSTVLFVIGQKFVICVFRVVWFC